MLDPDEVAEYEAWKERKLVGSIDLSVGAYNAEMATAALAWEEGVRAYSDQAPLRKSLSEILDSNPHRKPGMRGHTA